MPLQAKTLPVSKSLKEAEEPRRLVMSNKKKEDDELTLPIQQQSAGDYAQQSVESIVRLVLKLDMVADSVALSLGVTHLASHSWL